MKNEIIQRLSGTAEGILKDYAGKPAQQDQLISRRSASLANIFIDSIFNAVINALNSNNSGGSKGCGGGRCGGGGSGRGNGKGYGGGNCGSL